MSAHDLERPGEDPATETNPMATDLNDRGDIGEPPAGAAGEPRSGATDDDAPGGIDIATQRLARPAAVMAVGTLFSRITGLGRIMAMVAALGVVESRIADSYNIANTLPVTLYELALGGVLGSVFIPVLVEELRTKPHREAWRSVSTLVTLSVAILLGLTLVAVALAPYIIDIFSGRVGGEEGAQQHDLATFFLRLFAPQIVLFGIAAIAGGLLNAHGRFAVPMFSPIVTNLVIIATFVLFAILTAGVPTNASVGDDVWQKLLLGLGTTCGIGAMAAVNWAFLRSLPGRIRVVFDVRHPAVRKLARLSIWMLVYVVVNAIGLAVSLALANGQQGGPTAYVTAFAFFQLPYGVAAVSVLTAIMPKLSAHFVDGETASFRARTAGGVRAMALLMLPATAAYIVLAEPIIQFLLERGIVSADSVELVAGTLQMFAIGLLPFAVFTLLMRSFYARQDSKTPAIINIWANIVTIGLDFALYPLLGVEGLALAHSLGYVFAAAVAWWLLARRIDGLEARATIVETVKAGAASLIAAAAMWLLAAGLGELLASGQVLALVQIVVAGGLGMVAFAVGAWAMRAQELASFAQLVPARYRARLSARLGG